MTANYFFCRQSGAVSREQCATCFSAAADLRRVYLTRAICASAHGHLRSQEVAVDDVALWEPEATPRLSESRVA
jgi:hypothetical protein